MRRRRLPPVVVLAFSNPRSDLRVAEEADAIVEGLRWRIRRGWLAVEILQNVGVADLLEHLDADPTFAARIIGFHFGGHGSPEAIKTADGDGEPVYVAGLAQVLGRLPRLRWIFLNACSTGAQVEALQSVLHRRENRACAIVATDSAIRDDAALVCARAFYRRLAGSAPDRPAATIVDAFAATRGALEGTFASPAESQTRMLRPAESSNPDWPWHLHLPDDEDAGLYVLPSYRTRRRVLVAAGLTAALLLVCSVVWIWTHIPRVGLQADGDLIGKYPAVALRGCPRMGELSCRADSPDPEAAKCPLWLRIGSAESACHVPLGPMGVALMDDGPWALLKSRWGAPDGPWVHVDLGDEPYLMALEFDPRRGRYEDVRSCPTDLRPTGTAWSATHCLNRVR